jgi:hypothetical protein
MNIINLSDKSDKSQNLGDKITNVTSSDKSDKIPYNILLRYYMGIYVTSIVTTASGAKMDLFMSLSGEIKNTSYKKEIKNRVLKIQHVKFTG